mgnify:CR=1 FL=1
MRPGLLPMTREVCLVDAIRWGADRILWLDDDMTTEPNPQFGNLAPLAGLMEVMDAHDETLRKLGVKRDDLVTFHADGTHGSAVAGLTRCFTQSRVNTPRPVWNPDVPQSMVFQEQWQEVPDTTTYDNGFKLQWEEFIRHIFDGAAWKYDLIEGVKGVQLAELGLKSSAERRWLTVPDLSKEVG